MTHPPFLGHFNCRGDYIMPDGSKITAEEMGRAPTYPYGPDFIVPPAPEGFGGAQKRRKPGRLFVWATRLAWANAGLCVGSWGLALTRNEPAAWFAAFAFLGAALGFELVAVLLHWRNSK